MTDNCASNTELTNLTGFLLRVAHNCAQKRFQEVFGRGGISSLQFSVLVAISSNPGTTHNELVKAVHGTKSILTTAMKPLLSEALVTHERDILDNRIVRYSLTDKGHNLIPELDEKIREADSRVVGGLSPLEVEKLQTLLKAVAQLDQ